MTTLVGRPADGNTGSGRTGRKRLPLGQISIQLRGHPDQVAFLLVVIGLFLVRTLALPLAEHSYGDEYTFIFSAQRIARGGALITERFTDWIRPPLNIWLLALGFRFVPDPSIASFLPHVLLSILTGIPVYAFVRRQLGDEPLARIAAVLYLAYPLSIRLGYSSMTQTPLVFFVWMCLWFLAEYRSRDGALSFLVLAGLSLTLASASRYEAWYLTPVIALLFVRRWSHLLLFLTFAALVPVAWCVASWRAMGDALWGIRWTAEYTAVLQSLGLRSVDPFKTRLVTQPANLYLSLTPVVVFFAGWGLYTSCRRRRFLGCAAMSLLLMGVLFVTDVRPAGGGTEPYYVALSGTLLLPYAAIGLKRLSTATQGQLEWGTLALFAVAAMMATPYLLTWSRQGGFPDLRPIPRIDPDERAVASWLRSHVETEEHLVLDHVTGYREYRIVFAGRGGVQNAWLAPGAIPGDTELPLDVAAAYVRDNHASYLIYTAEGRLAQALQLPSTGDGYLSVWGVTLQPVLQAGPWVVSQLQY